MSANNSSCRGGLMTNGWKHTVNKLRSLPPIWTLGGVVLLVSCWNLFVLIHKHERFTQISLCRSWSQQFQWDELIWLFCCFFFYVGLSRPLMALWVNESRNSCSQILKSCGREKKKKKKTEWRRVFRILLHINNNLSSKKVNKKVTFGLQCSHGWQ